MLTGLIGTGGAVLVAGIALLAAKSRGHLPGRATDQIVLTAAVIFMIFAGLLATYIGIGQWAVEALRWAKGLAGSAGTVILVLLGLYVLIKVAVAVFRTATDRALWIAFAFPLISASINAGIFLDINNFLYPIATQTEAMFRAKLGA